MERRLYMAYQLFCVGMCPVGWSLTLLFSTNTAISETNGYLSVCLSVMWPTRYCCSVRILMGCSWFPCFWWFRYADPNVRLSTQRGPSQTTSLAVGHPKLAKLEEIVLDHFVQFDDDRGVGEASTRVIVFSEYRDSVNEITEILSQHRPLVRVMSFIGHSSAGRTSRGFTHKDQLKVSSSCYK